MRAHAVAHGLWRNNDSMRRHAPQTTVAEKPLDWTMLSSLVPFLNAYRGRAAVAIVLLIVAKCATVTVPMVLKRVVDSLDVQPGALAIIPVALVLAYGALRLSGTAFKELQSTLFARVRHGIERRVSMQVVGHLHDLSLRFHLERKTGEVARDIGRGTASVSTLLNYLLFTILPTLIEVTLVALILLTQYNAGFASVTVVTVVLYAVATLSITRWRIKFRAEMNRWDSEANSYAIDGLLNYETVKYFGNEEYELKRYQGALQNWEDVAVQSQASLSLLNGIQGLLIALGVTGTMYLAASGVADGSMSIGDLVAVHAYLLQLFLPLGFLGTIYSMLKHALTDMERLFGLLERKSEVVDIPDAGPLVVGDAAVVFEDVDFSYDPERQILHGVTLNVPAGSKLAIVGPSGSGKSTLARLLYRFYDISSGEIRIDGQDIREVDQGSLRSAIGIVPQDTVLFNDTLGYNIRYGRLDATDEEVRAAADLAQLSSFIERLPDGYDTVVGERGLKLSGGEKQRVAIARAVLKNPRIMIFDEATSSLDSISEQAILGAINRLAGTRTSLVIAHRLSTVVDADEIVVLEHGVVVERGTHGALLERDGQYAEMWRLQQQEAAS
ncbi:MAG: ABC-type transport system involved in Fe-S cluster assembly fused permease/ATPase subunit [Bradymonadia bacterium]|jgi:ABC-type transport system involved in Fe-S cluster assembly fused permease/ATPase subunit